MPEIEQGTTFVLTVSVSAGIWIMKIWIHDWLSNCGL
jgi:hypothetical protein